jgi:hypothetical protein
MMLKVPMMRVASVCCAVVVVTAGCGGLDPAVEESVVFMAVRPGEFVVGDSSLSAMLRGERRLTERDVAGAACHSLLGHAGDWSVGPQLVVSSRADLVRAAEIVVSGEVSRENVERIESLWFELGDEFDVEELAQQARVQVAVAEKYVRLRAEPPSDDALDRFAVYVQNETLTVQRVVVVDAVRLESVDFEGLPGQYSTVEYQVAGSTDIRSLDKSDCARVLSGGNSE